MIETKDFKSIAILEQIFLRDVHFDFWLPRFVLKIKQIMEVKNKPNFKFKSNNALIGQSNHPKFHDVKYEELLMIPFLFNFLNVFLTLCLKLNSSMPTGMVLWPI
ncbi:hypothetical protein D2V93_15455 [Flagellimonas taeanensis]|nr:hypothetical protein D2V93_15455 [Allomuricauda taeanensis]